MILSIKNNIFTLSDDNNKDCINLQISFNYTNAYYIGKFASREEFDKETEAFCLAQTLKEERLRAGLTQEQLAEKIGTKKTYISRLENGKSDIKLNTLFRIFEGLGRRVILTIL